MKIVCIGQNYAAHIAELGSTTPTEPLFFIKPDTALLRNNDPFFIPDFSDEIHYECELVVRINRVCKAIDEKFAGRSWDALGLGIDFTARDIQRRCKAEGLPWELAKAFDHSAAIAPEFIPKEELPQGEPYNFKLYHNDTLKQVGVADDMIFSIDQVIAHVTRFVTLKIGDLVFLGTPSGVGRVAIGDTLRGELMGREMFNFKIK